MGIFDIFKKKKEKKKEHWRYKRDGVTKYYID